MRVLGKMDGPFKEWMGVVRVGNNVSGCGVASIP